ncbi:MAG: hypothetical protein WAW23_01195 [Candidatus Methanoperedens sp.]
MEEIYCNSCKEKLTEGCKLSNYPDEFSVYLCPGCGHENEWWILYGFDKGTNLESIIRALFLDSFLKGKEIMYDQFIQDIKEKYKDENFSSDAIHNGLNRLFNNVLVKNRIEANRYPINKLHDEKYNKIIISHDNTLEDFFNKRIIRQWDLKHLTIGLNELKRKINSNQKIRHKNRWLVAFNYFSTAPEK